MKSEGRTTDQTELAKVAMTAKETDVRCAAVRKLADQALLTKLTVEDKVNDIRRTATETLTNQSVLAKLATEGADIRWFLLGH